MLSIGSSKPTVRIPERPLPPNDPRVMWMGEDDGPFKCGNCRFFNGNGVECAWVAKPLDEGDCCNQYKPQK